LLFNVLLSNVNQRFLLNNLEQQLDRGNLWFSRYFFVGIIFTGLIMINPLQVGLRYCMGFVRLDSFAKNHNVAHEISQACDQVAGARYFDSFLGYTTTVFAWWLILPAIYCLAEVVVPKCGKTDPLKMIHVKSMSKKGSSKIIPAELFIDESVSTKKADKALCESRTKCIEENDEENGQRMTEKFGHEIAAAEEVRTLEFPKHLSAKFPGMDEKAIASIYQQGYVDHRLKVEKELKYSTNAIVTIAGEEQKEGPSYYVRKGVRNITKKMPFLLAFYFYCKEKSFLMISIDLWISNTFDFWINFLQKNTSKNGQKDRLEDISHAFAKRPSVKRPGMKQLLSLDSEQFIQSMHVYDQAQVSKRRKLDNLWQQEHYLNHHTLPSYYELSYAVQEELHEFVIQPFSSCLAFIGIGHFFTPIGRYYWKVLFNNYKVFLLVCLGVWTDEAVEAYGLLETSERLCVDDRAFLKQEPTKKPDSKVLLAPPTGRKFSAQLLGFTLTQAAASNNKGGAQDSNSKDMKLRLTGQNKQNIREVLPAIISVLICSRVILFQVVPSLVLFATISMTLASFPLFIFSEFLAETLPPLLIWGEISREMSIEREMKTFVPLHPETRQPLPEQQAIRILTEEYSWRLSLRGTILFWHESRLLQFFHSILAVFFSFLLLIYTPDLLVYLVVILALLIPFILSKSLVLLLYLGNSLDLQDKDFPSWLQQNKLKSTTARVEPNAEGRIEEDLSILTRVDPHVPFAEEESLSNRNEEEVRMYEIPVFTEKLTKSSDKSSDYYSSSRDSKNSDSSNSSDYNSSSHDSEHSDSDKSSDYNSSSRDNEHSDSEDGSTSSFSSIDLSADIENSRTLSSSNSEEQ
jgi:hypothetical protein